MESRHEDLSHLSTPHLIRQAMEEAKLLVKAEVLHAKTELKEELRAAKLAGILLGAGAVLALCALSVLFVALALALPLVPALAAVIVGVVLLAIAGGLAFFGVKQVPRKPLPKTKERVLNDVTLAREQLT